MNTYQPSSVYSTILGRSVSRILNNMVNINRINKSIAQQIDSHIKTNITSILCSMESDLGQSVNESTINNYTESLIASLNEAFQQQGDNMQHHQQGFNRPSYQPPQFQQPMQNQFHQQQPMNYQQQMMQPSYQQQQQMSNTYQPQFQQPMQNQYQHQPMNNPLGNPVKSQYPQMGQIPHASSVQNTNPLNNNPIVKEQQVPAPAPVIEYKLPKRDSTVPTEPTGNYQTISASIDKYVAKDYNVSVFKNITSKIDFLNSYDAAKSVNDNLFKTKRSKYFGSFIYNKIEPINVPLEEFMTVFEPLAEKTRKTVDTDLELVINYISEALETWSGRVSNKFRDLFVNRFNRFLKSKSLQIHNDEPFEVESFEDILSFTRYGTPEPSLDYIKSIKGYNEIITNYLNNAFRLFICNLNILQIKEESEVVSVLNAIGHRVIHPADTETILQMYTKVRSDEDLNKLNEHINKYVTLATHQAHVLVSDLKPDSFSPFNSNQNNMLDSYYCDLDFFSKEMSVLSEPADLILTHSNSVEKFILGRSIDNKFIVSR